MRLVLLLLPVLLGSATSLRAQARLWQPDDRVTISSFNEILALAYNRRQLFAATPNGLEIYDVTLRRWELPSTIEDGYPVHERPVALAYDRGQGGLWLIAASGNAYLRSDLSGRWDLRPPFDVPREVTQKPASAAASDPAWRVVRSTVSLDPSGRRWPATAIVDSEVSGIYWVGTAGGNIIRADTRSLASEWLGFGGLSRGVSAIGLAADGAVWLGGDGLGPRDGISHGDRDLRQWKVFDALTARAPRRNVNRILAGDTIWAGAADGLYVLPEGAQTWQRIDEREGLPGEYVRSLERTRHGVWAGTNRGLALVDPVALRVRWRGLEGRRINGLAARGDTVWIATDFGLWVALPDSAGARVLEAPGVAVDARFRQRITSVAVVHNRIAALINDQVYLYDAAWSEPLLLQGGPAHELRSTRESLLILRRDGLEEYNFAKKASNYLSIPFDIPDGPVRDAARIGEYVWVATPAGATRLRLP